MHYRLQASTTIWIVYVHVQREFTSNETRTYEYPDTIFP